MDRKKELVFRYFDIYKGLESELTDLFYIECTEFYFAGRRRC